jgi:hypothetical protein
MWRQISHNGHSTDYMLSAVCEFVSRRLPIRSTTTISDRTVWHTHREYWPAHRIRFALVSHSFPIMFLHYILFWFLLPASLYSLHTIVHQTQLHRLVIQLVTTTRTYFSSLWQIVLSLCTVHGVRLQTATLRWDPYHHGCRQAGFRNVRDGFSIAAQHVARRALQRQQI